MKLLKIPNKSQRWFTLNKRQKITNRHWISLFNLTFDLDKNGALDVDFKTKLEVLVNVGVKLVDHPENEIT